MKRTWHIFIGVILAVILLKTFLIPDVYRFDLVIEPSFGSQTFVRIESNMFTSTIQYATKTQYDTYDIKDAIWKDKKAISLYTGKKILGRGKSLAAFYKKHGGFKGDDGIGARCKLIHGNSVIEEFDTELSITDDSVILNMLKEQIEDKYEVNWDKILYPRGK